MAEYLEDEEKFNIDMIMESNYNLSTARKVEPNKLQETKSRSALLPYQRIKTKKGKRLGLKRQREGLSKIYFF